MARGEPSKERPRSSGIAIAGCATLAVLATLTTIVSSLGAGDGCGPRAPSGLYPIEPFPGAGEAFARLHWRDTARARDSAMVPLPPDAAEAARQLAVVLSARGYVAAAGEQAPLTMPFSVRTSVLGGAVGGALGGALGESCGVIAAVAEGNAVITDISIGSERARASDPSVATLGACGEVEVRVQGIGSATVSAWALPGLTVDDASASGLPADVLLAHAEAEAIWSALGYLGEDVVVREQSTSLRAVEPPGAAPGSGCRIWIGIAEGAGSLHTAHGGHVLAGDRALDRAMIGAARCAGSGPSIATLVDDSTPGLTVWWRPFRLAVAASAGPTRPGATLAPTRAGAIRLVDLADLALPPPIPASPAAPP
jgi:hypothetical protein